MRLLLDTNVVVSALLWGGEPFKLIRAATEGIVQLYTSPVLLAELQDVLAREHLLQRLSRQGSSCEEAVGLYADLAIAVSPLQTPRVVLGDVDDDHVIAAAVAGRVDLIVSGDRHLLSLVQRDGIRIVAAREALSRIDAG